MDQEESGKISHREFVTLLRDSYELSRSLSRGIISKEGKEYLELKEISKMWHVLGKSLEDSITLEEMCHKYRVVGAEHLHEEAPLKQGQRHENIIPEASGSFLSQSVAPSPMGSAMAEADAAFERLSHDRARSVQDLRRRSDEIRGSSQSLTNMANIESSRSRSRSRSRSSASRSPAGEGKYGSDEREYLMNTGGWLPPVPPVPASYRPTGTQYPQFGPQSGQDQELSLEKAAEIRYYAHAEVCHGETGPLILILTLTLTLM